MRIISKTRDYYDIGLSYGIDPKCVYVRDEEEFHYSGDTGDNPGWFRDAMMDENLGGVIRGLDRRSWSDVPREYVDEVLVLFCGQVYLGIAYGGSYRWSFDDLISAIAAGPDCPARRSLVEKRKNERGTWFLPRHRELKGVYETVSGLNSRKGFLDGIMVAADTPIVVFEPGTEFGPRYGRDDIRATRNAVLKDIGFASVMDPYTAFQELSMYMTNVIGIGDPPICEISDRDKLEEHGFDSKSSFRHPVK